MKYNYKRKMIRIARRSGDTRNTKLPFVNVRFYREDDHVIAIFPTLKQRTRAGLFMVCYTHAQNHSLSEYRYHARLPVARKPEYEALATELAGRGYRLRVLNRDW